MKTTNPQPMNNLQDVFSHFNHLIDAEEEKMRQERIKASKPIDPEKARRKLSKALPKMSKKPNQI